MFGVSRPSYAHYEQVVLLVKQVDSIPYSCFYIYWYYQG